MRGRSIVRFILYFILLVMGCACTLSVEEVVTPPVEQPSDPGTGENPGEDPGDETITAWEEYFEFVTTALGDGSNGLAKGDILTVNFLPALDFDVIGGFTAVVDDTLTPSVTEALLSFDGEVVCVESGQVVHGTIEISQINQHVAQWCDSILKNDSSLTECYYSFERSVVDWPLYDGSDNSSPKDYLVTYSYVREKASGDTEYHAAASISMRGDADVDIECYMQSTDSSMRASYYRNGTHVEGSPGLEMRQGPSSVPPSQLLYDTLISYSGTGLEGYETGDKVKAILKNGDNLSGTFEVEFSDDSSIYVSNANVEIGQSNAIVIDDVIMYGDLSIDEVKAGILGFCESTRNAEFSVSSEDYFRFERTISPSSDMTIYMYDEEWRLLPCSVGSFDLAWEYPCNNYVPPRMAIKASLEGPSGEKLEIEAQRCPMFEFGVPVLSIIRYENGNHSEGSGSFTLYFGPSEIPSDDYFYNLACDRIGSDDLDYANGDRCYSIVNGFQSCYGHFSATVIATLNGDFAVRVDDAVLLVDDETVVVSEGEIVGSSSVSIYRIEEIVHSYMDDIRDNDFNLESSYYFKLERDISGESILAYNHEWGMEEYCIDSLQFAVEANRDGYGLRHALRMELHGGDDVVLEAEWTPLYDFVDVIEYFRFGNIETGSPGLEMTLGSSFTVDAQYYIDTMSMITDTGMLNYLDGDTVQASYSDYSFEHLGCRVDGSIRATFSDGDFLIDEADCTFDSLVISIRNDEVTLSGEGPEYWDEDAILSSVKKLVRDTGLYLDANGIVDFVHERKCTLSWYGDRMDMDYIPRTFNVEKCALTRDKSGDVVFECILRNERTTVTIIFINGEMTYYDQSLNNNA